jgi:hypothetical protein
MSTTPQHWCDLAEEVNTVPAVVTGVRIGYQGTEYEVDLGEAALKAVEDLMTAVASRGRKVTRGGQAARSLYQSKMERTEHGRRVREWWRKQGHEIGDAGAIPWDAVEDYNAANPLDIYEK